MKRFARFGILAVAICSSPALAQQGRAYTCTDSKNVVDHYWFGPGFFQMAEDRPDGTNECARLGSKCEFAGTKFTGTGATWKFEYDASTGAYSLNFTDDGYVETGTCRPD